MDDAETRLAVYGTLAPGRPNHHHLADLVGSWIDGRVRGRLVDSGWGATLGFPGMVLDDGAEMIEVQVLESSDLPAHWFRLDAFEGSGYRRELTAVQTANGTVRANIYVLASG